MRRNAERHAGGRPRILPRSQMGKKIEMLAGQRGLRADELAAAAGVSTPTLNRILTGRISSPRIQTVSALADALGVKMERLVG